MSVINQMLRDLDQRGQSAQSGGAHPGVQSVAPLPLPKRPRKGASVARVGAVLGLAAVVLAGLAWHWGTLAVLPASVPALPATPAPMAATSAPPSVAAPVADSASSEPAVAVQAPGVLSLLQEQPVRLRLDGKLDQLPESAVVARPAQASVKPKAAPATERVAVAPAGGVSATVATAPTVAAPVTKTEKASPALAAQPPAAVQTSAPQAADVGNPVAAAREALAQAQALWASGNAAAAVELLREALQAALRMRSGSVAMDTTMLAMVRELARMQIGTGQAEAAHELLVQHEARFRGQADYWGTRANAAQRLGQHADSVQSYMQALQFRPHEQRWLLGTAVSLAAMGQTAAATSMLEKARAEGPVPREIAEYLRQMGVVAK